jgi:hypothetical protein
MIQCGNRSLPPSSFLLLENQQFGILGDVIALRSEAYDSHRTTTSSPYRIRSHVSPSSLVTFLHWCRDIQQSHPINITSENVFDLAALADEFRIQVLRDTIASFLDSNRHSLLIPSIHYRLDHGDDTTEQEAALARDLLGFVDDDSLASLPLSLLKRLITFPDHSQFQADETAARAAFDRLFGFCVRLLDRHGSSASSLFEGIDLQLCTAHQLAVLHERRDFIWAFVVVRRGDSHDRLECQRRGPAPVSGRPIGARGASGGPRGADADLQGAARIDREAFGGHFEIHFEKGRLAK